MPFAIIVLFSHDLRRALAAFGRTPFFALFSGYHAEETVSDIVLALTSLSTRRVGALIVLERREGLKNYIENGSRIDSVVSYDLLVNVFAPGTPLARRRRHRLAGSGWRPRRASFRCRSRKTCRSGSARATARRSASPRRPTRSRCVVSEERGTISLARGGQLHEDLDGKSLRDLLFREFAAYK